MHPTFLKVSPGSRREATPRRDAARPHGAWVSDPARAAPLPLALAPQGTQDGVVIPVVLASVAICALGLGVSGVSDLLSNSNKREPA